MKIKFVLIKQCSEPANKVHKLAISIYFFNGCNAKKQNNWAKNFHFHTKSHKNAISEK
jgi:hypothetical protein